MLDDRSLGDMTSVPPVAWRGTMLMLGGVAMRRGPSSYDANLVGFVSWVWRGPGLAQAGIGAGPNWAVQCPSCTELAF